jgi:endonuclease YncB( thermonuclease family)
MHKQNMSIAVAFLLLASPCQAADPLTAIDILFEPDDVMVVQAQADNLRLRENYPSGFALDATHIPHISVLQCNVRTQDLDKVSDAVKRVIGAQKPVGMELEATGYFAAPWAGLELAGITVAPTPQLLKYQEAILSAVSPFIAKNGTVAALVPNEDGKPSDETIASYINTFATQHTGGNYNPHVTIGLGREDFVGEMIAASYTPFTFKIKNASIYQLGDFGTARKKIWTSVGADPLTVTRCIDGDTLQLSNGEKVRLIGVDTPESKNNAKTRRDSKRTGQDIKTITAMGKEAVEFTRKLVEGKQVRLDYDVDKKDRYGRTLAYVYVVSDIPNVVLPHQRDGHYDVRGEKYYEEFLNATLIWSGYAQVMTVPPNVKYQDLFVKLEKEARDGKRGLWR